MRAAVILLLALAPFLPAACSSTRRSEAISGSLPAAAPAAAPEEGKRIFMETCNQCHPGGEAGLGPRVIGRWAFVVRLQVRKGFGAMPAFSEEEISPAGLDEVIAYLKSLGRRG